MEGWKKEGEEKAGRLNRKKNYKRKNNNRKIMKEDRKGDTSRENW